MLLSRIYEEHYDFVWRSVLRLGAAESADDDAVHDVFLVAARRLPEFKRWYSQAGTPRVTARGRYDAPSRSYTLSLEQHCAPSADQPTKLPFLIPVAMGLVGMFIAEIFTQLSGLGNLLETAAQTYHTDQALAVLLVIMALGVTLLARLRGNPALARAPGARHRLGHGARGIGVAGGELVEGRRLVEELRLALRKLSERVSLAVVEVHEPALAGEVRDRVRPAGDEVRVPPDQLHVGANLFELAEVRTAAEHRLVQGLPHVLVVGKVAAASMCATVGEDLRLVDVETVWRRDVAVGIDDHREPPVVGVDCIKSVHPLH